MTLSSRPKPPTLPPPAPRAKEPSPRRPLPSPFNDPTRAVNDHELVNAVRSAPGPGRSLFEEPTRLGDVDADLLLKTRRDEPPADEYPPKFLPANTEIAPPMHFDEDEATRMADMDRPRRPPPPPSGRQVPPPSGRRSPKHDESTRAVDIRNDPSINDIDWDID
jgi:hypothetical protein